MARHRHIQEAAKSARKQSDRDSESHLAEQGSPHPSDEERQSK
jgi:hypothetical protein